MEKEKHQHNKKLHKKKMEFEFCKVCKLNHGQGRRHNYFPNHTKSLSSFLSRFLRKLSDVRFFLKNPTFLRPEHASRNRLWCVFCDSDIEELNSIFVCNNAIRHLASPEHLKTLKNFLWKYGGGMDRVDSFRVSDSDLAKWENKCKALTNATPSSSGRMCGTLLGDSKDIHDKIYSNNLENSERNTFHSFELSSSNGFLPLQNYTNEKNQVSHPKVSEVANLGHCLHETIALPANRHNSMNRKGMHANESAKDLTVHMYVQHTVIGNCTKPSVGFSPTRGVVGRLGNGKSSDQVLQILTQIPPLLSEESKANVHSGAPPPWLENDDANQLSGQVATEFHTNGILSSSTKSAKSQKLNPNRVGAAWAEKRKIEMELEKRGETVTTSCDANWLPNFGRVWQFGSRKESRKEFETENEKLIKISNVSEMPVKIQPYISKRMRKEHGDSKDNDDGHFT